ncbi:orotidine-5'-phosphate decarboxylase [Candidatus Kinetoplastibacterium desouzaii TCC079E]|uniref:Orotidine 5'-phosphate decarboxylase n=1 Tax=Candidatus Kinetoplastidibacterium desouzai TCC079E TaxID=1208919 RepID=M1L256_9PROT|nr:orotidine-5'-phosphate decarboxylase [Candidatus Kinetoplastibacterium desouzaii]AGF46833.1 orotidine-5'-phosphate decarboxylase [Candidatus Kinetoplastibacterium desouzaii TCC079E]
MKFIDKLEKSFEETKSLLQIGLDPNPNLFPHELRHKKNSILDFCIGIVDATAEYACSFKPQIAYFSANRAEEQLEELCSYIKNKYPNLPIVLDSKRGDIGSTAENYAIEAFERYKVDALTVNPFLGFDSIIPYMEWKDKGIIVLCRTSNPSGSDLQFLQLNNGLLLYEYIAKLVSKEWNKNNQFGLVVGATYPKELSIVRKIIGERMPILIPGIGFQGGDIKSTVLSSINQKGNGIIINSSRSILYASNNDNWKESASFAAKSLRDSINNIINNKFCKII